LLALLRQALGETAKAMVALEQALALAEPGGFVRAFVDKGAPMTELLRQAAGRGLAKGYVARLLQAWGKTLDPDLPVARVMVEPLTGRELEVLRLLVAGLSDREIAQELTIALSTAKSHAHKVYRKLDVNSRTQAVARAHKWNLL